MFKGLMPTYTTTEANVKNQEPTQSAHCVQDSDKSGSKTKNTGIAIPIPV